MRRMVQDSVSFSMSSTTTWAPTVITSEPTVTTTLPIATKLIGARRSISPLRDGGAHWPARGVLHRLSRHGPGIDLSGEAGISVSGPTPQVAESTSWNTGHHAAGQRLRLLSPKSRPGCEQLAR